MDIGLYALRSFSICGVTTNPTGYHGISYFCICYFMERSIRISRSNDSKPNIDGFPSTEFRYGALTSKVCWRVHSCDPSTHFYLRSQKVFVCDVGHIKQVIDGPKDGSN